MLDAVATALRLDSLERDHLSALVKPSRVTNGEPLRARPALRSMMAALESTPAVLHGPRLEVVAVNRAAAALIHDFDAMPVAERNMARWMFLDPKARRVYLDWPDIAQQMVAILRVAGGRDVGDSRLAELVGELSRSSPEFANYWAAQRLFEHTYGPKRFHHDVVGAMTLNYETMHLPADPGLSLILYTADRGSPSEARLRDLTLSCSSID